MRIALLYILIENVEVFMCGRYYVDEDMLSEINMVVHHVEREINEMKWQGDICPSMLAPVIYKENRRKVLGGFRWGFSKYQGNGLLINARTETVSEKVTFRDSFAHRRCVIPARGFYEWDGDKNKFRFRNENREIMYLAGLYRGEQGQNRFVILTTGANPSVLPVHDRMPLLLQNEMLEEWLSDDSAAHEILKAVPPEIEKCAEWEQIKMVFT